MSVAWQREKGSWHSVFRPWGPPLREQYGDKCWESTGKLGWFHGQRGRQVTVM